MKNKLHIFTSKVSPILFFVLFALTIGCIGIACYIFNINGRFFAMYFYNPNDSFMDFYHPIIFSTVKNPYSFELVGAIYPPICYLIFGFLSKFVGQDALVNAFVLRNEQNARMLYMLCTFVCILFILYVVNAKLSGKLDG